MLGEQFERIRENLQGAPRWVLIICLTQLVFLLLAVLIGVDRSGCAYTVSPGSHVSIDCDTCWESNRLGWRDAVLLVVGLVVIGIGACAALLRSKTLCKIYGITMLMFTFTVGLTAILLALEIEDLKQALREDELDAQCKKLASDMVPASRERAILYGANAIVDLAGALFAYRSKEFFAFQEIAASHARFEGSQLL